MRLRRLAAAGAAVLALAAPAAARVADAPSSAALSAALAAPGVQPRLTGAVALDLSDGRTLLSRNAGRPLRPASTEKLTVALAALQELGPGARVETAVLAHGERRGATLDGDLVLLGRGDPSLHRDDLALLARRVAATGLRTVRGSVVGDESYFDARRTAPGWKPSYYKEESAPLSALVVDRAWLDGRQRDQPALAAAVLFTRVLEAHGVHVSGRPRRGVHASGDVEIASVVSPTVRALVAWMNAQSDDFVAEMLLKGLGARRAGAGTTAAGAAVVRAVLAGRGVPLRGVRLVDGSGLSAGDRLTARALAALLASALGDAQLGRIFPASLPVAGKTGTLEDRMRGGPAYGRVRAKTGTTDAASALAGYAGRRYVFAIRMNGRPGAVDAARAAQDRVAQLLAGAL